MAKQVILIEDSVMKKDAMTSKEGSQVTIKDIVNNISKKYIESKDAECITVLAEREPLTQHIWTTPLDQGITII